MIAGALAFSGSVSAQMGSLTGGAGMMGNYWQNGSGTSVSSEATSTPELQGALSEIYASQGVDANAKIDCAKVTDAEFEKLGDAYMGLMVPDESRHEAMDTMMGGEGSESLSQAHINMGRSYLGCWSGYDGSPLGMMGYRGYGNGYPSGMMGGYGWGVGGVFGYSWFGVVTMVLVWTVLGLGIIVLVKFLTKK